MVQPELSDYIRKCREAGMPDGAIMEELTRVGWSPAVCVAALAPATAPVQPATPPVVTPPAQQPVQPSMSAPVKEHIQEPLRPVVQATPARLPPLMQKAPTMGPIAASSKSYTKVVIVAVLAFLLIGAGVSFFLWSRTAHTPPQTSAETTESMEDEALATEPTVVSVQDCGTDLACFIEASLTCGPATTEYTFTTDMLGVEQTQTARYEVAGALDGTCSLLMTGLDVQGENLPAGAVEAYTTSWQRCSFSPDELVRVLSDLGEGTVNSKDWSSCESSPPVVIEQ